MFFPPVLLYNNNNNSHTNCDERGQHINYLLERANIERALKKINSNSTIYAEIIYNSQ